MRIFDHTPTALIRSITLLIAMVYAGLQTALTQNLVANPSFEDLIACPALTSPVTNAPPWKALTPSNTPDLYHPCATNAFYAAPNYGLNSFQEAYDGVGYAGLFAYSNNTMIANREYIQTELREPMQAGKHYYIEFFATAYEYDPDPLFIYSNSIGLSVRNEEYTSILPGTLSENSVVAQHTGPVITSPDWTAINGCYIAEGGESHIAIGDFRRAMDVSVETNLGPDDIIVSILFVDMVSIHLFDPLPDTILICENETISFDASFLDADYRWNTGEESPMISITQSGYYSVSALMGSCALLDEVYVIDPDEVEGLPPSLRICENEPTTLSALAGYDSYRWSTGEEGPQIIVNQAGEYRLTVTNTCQEFVFSTLVTQQNCDCNLYVPNAFSPNADGVNDNFSISPGCDLAFTIHTFQVYDRWGALIFDNNGEQNASWDGKYRGSIAAEGVYVWVLDYSYTKQGVVISKQAGGDLLLLR